MKKGGIFLKYSALANNGVSTIKIVKMISQSGITLILVVTQK
jgi:hypothetical protein